MDKKKLVIVGCGDGGIMLSHRTFKDFDVTLIDKSTMHYFQPVSYTHLTLPTKRIV